MFTYWLLAKMATNTAINDDDDEERARMGTEKRRASISDED